MPETSLEDIENDIKTRLDNKLAAEITAGTVEVEVMPDTPMGFKRPLQKKGRISICYMDTDFDKIKNIGAVIQEEYNKFGFFLVSKTRLGSGGIYDLYRLVRKHLIGYAPLGHEKLSAKKNELYMREVDTGLWFIRFELSAKSQLTEFNDDPAAALISEIRYRPPSGQADDVIVNASTIIGDNPIIN